MSLTSDEIKTLNKFLKSPIMNDQSRSSTGWKNFTDTQRQKDAIVIDIDNRQALSALMILIHALNQKKNPQERIVMRAAAGGRNISYSDSYSASNVVNSDIVIRLTGDEFTKIRQNKNSNIVTVGPSLQIGELDKALFENHGLVLPTASLIPYVTAAGLAAPGGHGTGIDQPSFAGLLRGMTLCLETGEIIRLDQSHPDFATIAAAHNGLFGIVLDMDIECIPAQKMQCVMEKRSPIELMEEVENGLFEHDPYVSAMYVPTYLPDELTNRTINNVIIYRWRPVPMDTANRNFNPNLADLTQAIQGSLGTKLNIPEILRRYPKVIPYYMRHFALPATVGDKEELAVGNWPELVHYQTAYPTDLKELGVTFPVTPKPKGVPQGTEVVAAMKEVMMQLQEHAKRGEYPLTYAVYIRVLQGTNGGLSFTADGPVCAMDILSNVGIKGFAELEHHMQDFVLNQMHGKLHWGKNAPLDLDYEKLYGSAWNEFKTALENWHRQHGIETEKSVLLNPLFSHVLKYPVPTLVDKLDDNTRCAPPLEYAVAHSTAMQAQKLMKKIGDDSPECNAVKAEINQQISQTSRRKNSLFTSSRKRVAAEPERNNKNSNCVIL